MNEGDPFEQLNARGRDLRLQPQMAFYGRLPDGGTHSALDPNARRAALVGLSATHTRSHVIRGDSGGCAFSLRDTFNIFQELKTPEDRIRLGGGGSRSVLGG